MIGNQALASLKQGVLICNEHARIVYFNKAYEIYLGHPLEEVRGQKISRYRKNAQAPGVIASGVPLEGIIRHENNQEYYASIYPVFEGEKVIGSISIITSLEQEYEINRNKPLTLAERVREFEKREIELAVAANGGGTEGKRKAAKELGISLATLYNKLKCGYADVLE